MVQMKLPLAATAALAVVLASSAAAAQEIQLTGPIGGCRRLFCREDKGGPASVEWSSWLAGGGGVLHRAGGGNGAWTFGVGMEATAGLWTFSSGTPERPHAGTLRSGDRFQLRGGPWASAVTDGKGIRGEGGVLVLYSVDRKSPWIVPAVRLGAGWGNDQLGKVAHLVTVFTLGPRSAPDRWRRSTVESEPEAPLAFVSGFRTFVMMRAAFAGDAPYQLTFGIELEPTFLLPPYSWRKFFGGDPND
jgi:hypothetical protein